MKLGQRRIILLFKYESDDKTVEVNVHAGLEASLTGKWIKFHVLLLRVSLQLFVWEAAFEKLIVKTFRILMKIK